MEEGVATGPALFCLLQDEIIAETVNFITESLFTRWLWGKCEDEGASVKLASPRVGFRGACGINRRGTGSEMSSGPPGAIPLQGTS